MTLADLIPLLHPSKIYASKIINVGLKENRVVGLSVECPNTNRMDEMVALIKSIVGDGFEVNKLPNDGTVRITTKP